MYPFRARVHSSIFRPLSAISARDQEVCAVLYGCLSHRSTSFTRFLCCMNNAGCESCFVPELDKPVVETLKGISAYIGVIIKLESVCKHSETLNIFKNLTILHFMKKKAWYRKYTATLRLKMQMFQLLVLENIKNNCIYLNRHFL